MSRRPVGTVRLGHPAESRCWSRPTPARRRSAASCATPGSRPPAPTGNRHRVAPRPRRPGAAAHRRCTPGAAATCAPSGVTVRLRGPLGLAARQRTLDVAGHGPLAAAVRVPQAPAQPAGPAARPRRARGGPGARPGHRVRLAARVRPRRRRPLDRLAGQRPQPQRRGAHLAARAGPPGGAGARHLAHLGGPGRGRAAARLRDGRRAAARRPRRPRRRPDRLRGRRPPGPRPAPLGRRARRGREPAGHDGRPRAGHRRGGLVGAGRRGQRFGRQRALVVLLTPLEPSAVEEGLLPVLPVADPAPPRRARLGPRPRAGAAGRDPRHHRRGVRRGRGRAGAGPPAAYRRAAAGRSGVDVVDADAERLPPALADHYLALKARGLL